MRCLCGSTDLNYQVTLGGIRLAVMVVGAIVTGIVDSLQLVFVQRIVGSYISFNSLVGRHEIRGHFINIEFCLWTHALGVSTYIILEHDQLYIRHVVHIDVVPYEASHVEVVSSLSLSKLYRTVGKRRQRSLVSRSSTAVG